VVISSVAAETIGALFGIASTALLALRGRHAGWGFVAYLASNSAWLSFACAHAHWGLFAQQIAFTASNFLGIWVWLVRPWLRAIEDPLDMDSHLSNSKEVG
jgi:hypothetical protein